MKIASLLPIGPLDRFGYQHAAELVLRNHCEFFDRVYVIGSSRATKTLPYSSPKLVFIQDEKSLFKMDDSGNELLDFPKLNENVNRIKDLAAGDGCDLGVEIHINQYVPESNFDALRAHCRSVLDKKEPYGWLYKAYQYYDKSYYPSHRLPWIVNLRDFGPRCIFESDSLYVDGKLNKIQDSVYKDAVAYSLMDIMGCYTEKDDEEKFDYYTKVLNRTYGKGGTSDKYSAEVYFDYHRIKLLAKRPIPRPLCRYGLETLTCYPPDSIGESLVRSCGLVPRALFRAGRFARKFLPAKA